MRGASMSVMLCIYALLVTLAVPSVAHAAPVLNQIETGAMLLTAVVPLAVMLRITAGIVAMLFR